MSFEIKHMMGEQPELALIGIVKFSDQTQKDFSSYIKLNSGGEVISLEFYVNTHIDADLYGDKHV